MGEWTLTEKILFKLKQIFCKHRVLIMMESHVTEDEVGYELWCGRCGKTVRQIFYQKDKE